jgi:hypothetical protein
LGLKMGGSGFVFFQRARSSSTKRSCFIVHTQCSVYYAIVRRSYAQTRSFSGESSEIKINSYEDVLIYKDSWIFCQDSTRLALKTNGKDELECNNNTVA